MDVEVFEYNKGDYVSINSASPKKPLLGKIEEIQVINRTFTYTHYYRPEETHYGRMDHHGSNEIFKTREIKKGDLDSILCKIQVIKMKEYTQKKQFNDSKDEEIYLVRQYYDIKKYEFNPEYNKCICQKFVNPDDDFLLCECETAYHEDCVLDDSINCLYCGKQLKDEIYFNNTSKRKRNFEDLTVIPLKKINTGYNISNAKKYLITPKITNSNDAGKSSKISLTHVSPDNQKSISSLNKQQSSDRKEFSKINDIRYKKLLSQIDKYKQTNSSKHLVGIEKNRYTAKENVFTFLMYGFYEMQQNNENKFDMSEEEKRILGFNETQIFDFVKKIAIEIEATIYMEHNKNNRFKIMKEYLNRFRVILANLKDDSNYELRSKIIIGQMTPQILSKIEEKELTTSQKRKERFEKEQKYLKAHILDENDKLVAKTHKGEVIIGEEEQQKDSNLLSQNSFLEKEVENYNNGLILSKSKSDLVNMDDESEVSVHDPNYKIKKNMSVNAYDEQKSFEKPFEKEKDYIPNNKYIDQEVWRSLQPFVNGKKSNVLVERMKKGLPEKEANYLIENFFKNE